jgi:hypothetical protein
MAWATATVSTESSVKVDRGAKSGKSMVLIGFASKTDPIISPAMAPIMDTSPIQAPSYNCLLKQPNKQFFMI